jgi:hypothetical protein
MIQIIELLEERNLSFSFCLNKADTLVLCGVTLLFQTMDLKRDSKLLKDHEKLVNAVIKAADKAKAPGCYELKRVAGVLVTVDEPPPQSLPTPPRQSPDASLAAPPAQRTSPSMVHKAHPPHGRHIAASISETDLLLQQEKLRRMTMPQHAQQRADHLPPRPRGSFDCPRPTIPLSQRDHRLSLSHAQATQAAMLARMATSPSTKQTMEYLHLDSHSQPSSPAQACGSHPPMTHAQQTHLYAQLQKGTAVSPAEWEALVGSMDSGQLNVYDAIYGGPGLGLALAETPMSGTTTTTSATQWSPHPWDLTGFNLGDFPSGTASSHSGLSLSEDGLSSTDDLGSVGSMDFRNPLIPVTSPTDGYVLDRLDGYGL